MIYMAHTCTCSTCISLENTMLNFIRFTAVNRLWRSFWNIPALSFCSNVLYLVNIVDFFRLMVLKSAKINTYILISLRFTAIKRLLRPSWPWRHFRNNGFTIVWCCSSFIYSMCYVILKPLENTSLLNFFRFKAINRLWQLSWTPSWK